MSERLRTARAALASGVGIVIILAILRVIFHTLINHQYGFHRDELQVFDDARYLDWGYVPYPPVTPFIAAVARALFGESLVGLRLFSALAQAAAMIVAALMAREMGGKRTAQVVAGVGFGITGLSTSASSLFQYVSFDLLWWVLIAYFITRLLTSEDPRWWLAVGATIGLGMMTRYTMAVFVVGIVGGVLITNRHYLASRWLWMGVALSVLIFLPNLIWQIQHNFISLEFQSAIHARDIAWGRMDSFLTDQLLVPNPMNVPLWLAGLYFLFFAPRGRRYRMLGWMAVISFAVFLIAQGRGYYTAPLYPMLIAAGACAGDLWLDGLAIRRAGLARALAGAWLGAGAVLAVLLAAPVFPINSPGWDTFASDNGDFTEQVGWPELARTVASVYNALPPDQRARTGILGANYGEAGAINLYGPQYGLPTAISEINTYHLRGYGDPPPRWLIVIGAKQEEASLFFKDCRWVAANTNAYGVKNEESVDHPDIFLCGEPYTPWPELWKKFVYFG